MEKRNEDYFNESEKKCIDKLIEFNQGTGFFSKLEQTGATKGKTVEGDASGYTSDGRTVLIEMKNRNINLFDYETVYINAKKVAKMMLEHSIYQTIPIFVAFFKNGDVGIWNLTKLTKYKYYPLVKSYSKGYGKDEYSEQIGVYPIDAKVYGKDNDGNWMRKNYEF